MNQMKLSVIIPVCNVEKYIGTCLESIYRQGLLETDFEVIVIDDGSKDGSMQVVGISVVLIRIFLLSIRRMQDLRYHGM